ncbi:MAG: prepilin peptidase [Acidobacteria bacterium]|nr:MAG: prepilin peptidase [Acidobacteriota bacterium]TDI56666.1 MAG: prepilin peptidase [Acidobacteriota bacterium]
MTTVLVGLLGFGLGLAAHDLAIQGLTEDRLLRPLSGTCPNCAHGRGWLRFRCSQCGRSISREPFVAVVSALVAMGFANTIGIAWPLVPYFGFLLLSMALLVTDLEEFRIVDRLNLRGSAVLVVGLGISALINGSLDSLWRGLLGAVAYFTGATALWLLVRGRGFGAGDVKLAPQLGLFAAFVSWGTLGWAVFATALIGGVIALGMIALGAAKMKTELPYGPPMVIGAWMAIVMAGIGAFPIPT